MLPDVSRSLFGVLLLTVLLLCFAVAVCVVCCCLQCGEVLSCCVLGRVLRLSLLVGGLRLAHIAAVFAVGRMLYSQCIAVAGWVVLIAWMFVVCMLGLDVLVV